MIFSRKILSQLVVEYCKTVNIQRIVISPGSRSAPLVIGFTGDPFFKNHSIVDERCAAFFALGMAQQLKQPVALVCTSGSALLNYYPAIAEAYYSNIPLVVLSADRPSHLVDIGDGQTIQQEGVFGKHVLYSANCREGHEAQNFNESEIALALSTCINQQGPVHINLPFDEPLYETAADSTIQISEKIIRQNIEINYQIESFKTQWHKARKKMILVGVLDPDVIEESMVEKLANDPNLLVLTETTSNLHHPKFISAIDQLISTLSAEEKEALKPDVLLTFGGMIVSKRIKALLREFSPDTHWHVDPKNANDTFFCLKSQVKEAPIKFLNGLYTAEVDSKNDGYRDQWLGVRDFRIEKHQEYLQKIPYSDFLVFDTLFKEIPENYQLQLANSATVRYAQLFSLHPSLEVFCNRGTSGIDGSTSTAIGAATIHKSPTLLLTGDLSFFYDSNALWNNYIPKSFRIIVINNSGGGIFRILSGAKKIEQFDTYFETSHQLTAKSFCELYQFDYQMAESMQDLNLALESFYREGNRPKLLEIFTPNAVNDQVLISYFDFIK